MLGGLGDMFGMLKQAKQIKEKMEQMQAELATRSFEADAGGGAVVARVNGKHELLGLKIRPDVVNPAEVEMLEDLVRAAVAAAQRKSQEAIKEEMMRLTGGMPGLEKLMNPT
ncbi:MAG: YbaB/EbfC family nucleoid-associated protein [Phycisphaerae bacterium]